MIAEYKSALYRISYQGVSMIENALGNPNLIQISVVLGCSIIVSPQQGGGIQYLPNGESRKWFLYGVNTKLNKTGHHFIYARLNRDGDQAYLIFSVNDYAIDGTINGENPSPAYCYVKVGEITETDALEGATTQRKITFDFGKYQTDETREENYWQLRSDSQGNEYIITKYPVLTQGPLTQYATLDPVVPSIFEGIPYDNQTIWFNPATQRVEVIGGTGGGEAGSVKWVNITGKPTWIGDAKPTYNWSEIQGEKPFYTKEEIASKYVTIDTEQEITALKHFTAGLSVGESKKKIYEENGVVYIDADVAVTGAMTFYATAGRSVSTIMDAVTVDGITIKKENNVLKAVSGAGSSFDENAMWSALSGSSDNQINKSHLTTALDGYATRNWVIENYATKSELSAVSNKLSDFLEGSDTDSIINKWKELEAFLSGMAETDNLAEILETKADKKYVDSTFVTLATKQTITGEKTFSSVLNTAAIKASGAITAPSLAASDWVTIAGIKLRKLEDGALMLEGNLALTGALTMYASNGQGFDTIYDGLPIDNDTIYWQEVDGSRVLKAREGSGSSFDKSAMWTALAGSTTEQINKSHLTTALTGYATESWVSGKNYAVKATTLAGYGITDAYTKKESDGKYPTKTGSGASGTWGIGITGNAATASKWATARTITLGSYLSGSVSLDGSANVTLNANVVGLTSQGNKTAATGNTSPASGVRLYQVYNNGYPTPYGNLLSVKGGGAGELLLSWANANRIYYRSLRDNGDNWLGWNELAFITDNVASATKLQTARTLWGQSFNGTKNVSGDLNYVGNINFTLKGRLVSNSSLELSCKNDDTTSLTFTGTVFRPFTSAHNNIDLGASTVRWRDLYIGRNAYVDGITKTGDFYIGGIRLHKTADGVITLEGNLAVTGGITTYAIDPVSVSTVMDGVVVDGTTIKKENGKLVAVGGGEAGSVAWGNITGKPSVFATNIANITDLHSSWDAVLKAQKPNWLTAVSIATISDLHANWDALLKAAPSAYVTRWPSFAEVTSKPTTLSGYGITDAYTKTDSDSRYINTSGDTMTGNLYFKSSDYPFFHKNNSYAFYNIALNFESRSSSYFYPVRVTSGTSFFPLCTVSISSTSGGASLPLNNNSIRFMVRTGGWSDIGRRLIVLDHWAYSSSEITIYAIYLGEENGDCVVYLRGGVNYAISISGRDWVSSSDTILTNGNEKYPKIDLSGNPTDGRSFAKCYRAWMHSNGYGLGLHAENSDKLGGVSSEYFMRTKFQEGYYGMALPDGSDNNWIRTTNPGIIPYSSTIKSSLGTDQWQFGRAYIETVYTITTKASNWFRSTGNTGWLNETYGGGWYMTDGTWIRAYANKSITGYNIQGSGKVSANNGMYVYGMSGSSWGNGDGAYSVAVPHNENQTTLLLAYNGANNNITGSDRYFSIEVLNSGNRNVRMLVQGQHLIDLLPSKVTIFKDLLVEGGGTFYSSDIRYKSIIQQIKLSLSDIAKAPSFVYHWNKKGMKCDRLNLGGSAQYTQSILPWAVENNNGFLSMDYATVAYTFAVHTARHLLTYETRTDKKIKKLENRVKYLEKQLKKLGYEEVRTLDDQSV